MSVPTRRAAAPALAGLLTIAGITHFILPGFYDRIVPRALPGSPRTWVLASGGAELACAAAVAGRRTRRAGAAIAGLLFILVFPANVQMALDWRRQSTVRAVIGLARLPLQLPLVWWAWRVALTTPDPKAGPAWWPRPRRSAGR